MQIKEESIMKKAAVVIALGLLVCGWFWTAGVCASGEAFPDEAGQLYDLF